MVLAYQEYYTLEDYQHWEGDWELIKGMPYAMTPSPSVTHQTISGNFLSQIKSNTQNKHKTCDHCYVLMETDWQISKTCGVKSLILHVALFVYCILYCFYIYAKLKT